MTALLFLITFVVFAYRDLEEAGEQLGPRIFSTGQGVFATTDFQSYEEARDYLRRYQRHYRTNLIESYLNQNKQEWHRRIYHGEHGAHGEVESICLFPVSPVLPVLPVVTLSQSCLL